jgi:hypothetical protein
MGKHGRRRTRRVDLTLVVLYVILAGALLVLAAAVGMIFTDLL